MTYLNIRDYNIDPPEDDTIEVKCPECSGSGKQEDVKDFEGQIAFEEECLECEGCGYIYISSEEYYAD